MKECCEQRLKGALKSICPECKKRVNKNHNLLTEEQRKKGFFLIKNGVRYE